MNNPLFLIAGYGITFVAIVAYLMRLRRLERDVDREENAAEVRRERQP